MKDEFRKEFRLECKGRSLILGQRTLVMGVLNVTPDSFSDGGKYLLKSSAVGHAVSMVQDGADIIDIGGESSRPYSDRISLEEELERVIPVIESVSKEVDVPISIDTYKAEVARQAIEAGASIINDISAFRFDPDMVSVAADACVPVILMHMKGSPSDMQDDPVYGDFISEIKDFFKDVLDRAEKGGIDRDMIVLDPGIGFGKTFDHNLEILRELHQFTPLSRPILVGSSRKAFIGQILDNRPEDRDIGTMATVSASILNGAHIVRVHNLKMACETVKVIDTIMSGRVARG